MSIDMNEELPDPTPRGEDMLTQQALDDMAWMLRATRSPLLLSTLVHPNLQNAAILAEVALATRHGELVREAREIADNPGDFTISTHAEITTALIVYTKWMNPSEGRSIEELALWQLAPAGVLIHG